MEHDLIRRRSALVIGLLLLGASIGWRVWMAPRWLMRMPPGWSWEAQFIGTQAAPGAGGRWPEQDTTAIYTRSMRIAETTRRPDVVAVDDRYSLTDPLTKRLIWQYAVNERVDPRTGRHRGPDHRDDYLVFPRNVARGAAYSVRANYLEGVKLTYERDETVEGLLTFVFGYEGRAAYTAAYMGSAEYPGEKVEPGREIRCLDDRFHLRMWVEPITGEVVKLEEACPSGDYVYDAATGRPLRPVLRWKGATAGDIVLRRADQVDRERRAILWATTYGPLAGVCGALLAGVFAIAGRGDRRR